MNRLAIRIFATLAVPTVAAGAALVTSAFGAGAPIAITAAIGAGWVATDNPRYVICSQTA